MTPTGGPLLRKLVVALLVVSGTPLNAYQKSGLGRRLHLRVRPGGFPAPRSAAAAAAAAAAAGGGVLSESSTNQPSGRTDLPRPTQTLVINLDRDEARLAAVTAELRRQNIPFERLPAVNGAALQMEELKRRASRLARIFSTRGMIGCYLSHRTCWERAAGVVAAPSPSPAAESSP